MFDRKSIVAETYACALLQVHGLSKGMPSEVAIAKARDIVAEALRTFGRIPTTKGKKNE